MLLQKLLFSTGAVPLVVERMYGYELSEILKKEVDQCMENMDFCYY
jgi:hypothetical protein